MEVLICDDDELAVDINVAFVKHFFRRHNIVAHIESFLRPDEALKVYVKQHRIDLAILDIEMGNRDDGIELARYLKKINPSVFIIFVTDHKELSFEAFGVEAFGLIPKPLNNRMLSKHLKRAVVYRNGLVATREHSKVESQTELIKVGNSFVAKSQIICIEKDRKNVIVYTNNNPYVFTSALKELKEQLPEYFLYVNRSVIVNAKCVVEIHEKKTVQMVNEKIYDIARTKAEDIYKQLEHYIAGNR